MQIKVMQVGQLGTNCYLLEDEETRTAAVVDPGGVTLKVGDVLLTGDTLFQGSMGRTDFEGGSYAEIMASLGRLGRLSGDYHVLPGHMGASTLEQERKTNYYLREAMEG